MIEVPQDILEKLKTLNAKRLYVQAPEGMKQYMQGIADTLEGLGFEVVLHMDPTFGACDVPESDAKLFGCDTILHIGHVDFGVRVTMPVVYWPYQYDIDPVPLLSKKYDEMKIPNRVGILSSIQYKNILPKVEEFLKSKGHEVKNLGNILGCRHGAALPAQSQIDAFLFVGTGKFHPVGLAIKTEKPVLVLDIERNEFWDTSAERKKVLMLKAAAALQLEKAKIVGILMTTKTGQLQMHMNPFIVKKKLEEMGKKVYMFSMDMLMQSKLEGTHCDIYMNCACPRMGEDIDIFNEPIINPEDVLAYTKKQIAGSFMDEAK